MKKQFKVASKFTDITVGEYIKWVSAGESEILRLCAITGMSKEEAREVSAETAETALNTFQNALGEPVITMKEVITIEGVDYHRLNDFAHLTLAEHIDMSNNSASEQTFNKLMAICYRPLQLSISGYKSLQPYKFEQHLNKDNVAKFNSVTLDVALGLRHFFFLMANELLESFLDYSLDQAQVQLKKVQKILKTDLTTQEVD